VTSGGASVNSFRYRVAGWVMRHRRATAVGGTQIAVGQAGQVSARTDREKTRVVRYAHTLLPIARVSYDRRGEPYRSFDGAYALYDVPGKSVMDGAHPYWSWAHVHVFDIQTGRMTRLEQVR